MDNIQYKIATENEILSLSELFSKVYSKYYSLEELGWRYLINPIQKGKLFNCIAINESKKIVGHTAFIKHSFLINSRLYNGGLTVGSAVQNDYSGIFAPMYKYLEECFVNEFDFLYGFPNQYSYPFFIKIFEYKKIFSSLLQIECGNNYFSEMNYCNQVFDIISTNSRNTDSDFLLWRIKNNPLHSYYYFKHNDSAIIWKKHNRNEYDIIGISSINSIVNIEEKLISPVNTKINIFLTSEQISNKLRKKGLSPLKTSNTFVVKHNKIIGNCDTTLFQMLDLDIY